MRSLFHTATIAVTAVTIACLSGCEPQTPGEKLDEAIDEVQEAGEEFRREAKEAVDEIGDEMKPNEDNAIGEKAAESLEDAGDAIEDAIGGDKAAPEAGAINVEIGGGNGVKVDVQPKTVPD